MYICYLKCKFDLYKNSCIEIISRHFLRNMSVGATTGWYKTSKDVNIVVSYYKGTANNTLSSLELKDKFNHSDFTTD